MSRTTRLLTLAVFLLPLAFARPVSAELQIQGKPRWGFDGFVRGNDFNLLTVELFNNSDAPWQGELRLQASVGLGPGDIPTVQPDLLIESYGRRRIQFLVYLSEPVEYTLRWGRRGDESLRIDQPNRVDKPAVVQLAREDAFGSNMKGIPSFDEADFPSNAAGLAGLGTAVLDHVPRWTEAQSRAFRDWLHGGGTLHLYDVTTGKQPEFTGILSELNRPGEGFTLGGGKVVRHAGTLATATESFPVIAPSPQQFFEWQLSTSLYSLLKELTRPDHNWPLIFVMAVAYLLLLFPGCWMLGRRKGDYRLTYGAILAIVFVFSVGFRTVGARGYGEETSVHAAALVRPTVEGRAIVTQWSNLFVTAGGNYEISHALEGTVYSTGQTNEAVRGVALNRPYGKILVDVPAFSSRTLVHAGVVSDLKIAADGEPFDVEVLELNVSEGILKKLAVKFRGLPTDRIRAVGAVQGRSHFQLSAAEGGRYESLHVAESLDAMLGHNAWGITYWGWNQKQPDDAVRAEEFLNKVRPALIARDLGLSGDGERTAYSLPDGEIRLYITTDLPESLFAEGISRQQSGRMVISVPLRFE